MGASPTGWTSSGINSTWTVQQQGSHVVGHVGWTGYLQVGNTTWSNYQFSVSVKPSCWASEHDGLIFDANENGRYTLYITGGNRLVLGKWVGSSWVRLAVAPYVFDPSKWYVLSVYAYGGSVGAYVNGTLVLQANDSTFTNGGVGLESNDPFTFGNVLVTQLGSTIAGSETATYSKYL